jgi:hypothetical protein
LLQVDDLVELNVKLRCQKVKFCFFIFSFVLFYSVILSTIISASSILHMLLKRLFYRLITYIHVAEVFESRAECSRGLEVIRRCAATDVVRSTVRNSALTRDMRSLQSRGRRPSLCNNAAMSGVCAQLGPQNYNFVYSSRFGVDGKVRDSEPTVSSKSLNLFCF